MQPDAPAQTPSRSRTLGVVAPVLALLLTAGLVGCGSDSEGATSSTTTEASGPSTTDGDDGAGTASTTEADAPGTTGGGDDADHQAYVDVFASSYTAVGEELVTKEQAECLGEHYVDTIGLDELRAADISPDDPENDGDVFDKLELDEAKADELFEQFDACDIDPKELIVGLAQLFKEGPLTPDEQACFDDALTPEAIRASFVGSLLGEDVPDDPTDPTNCVDLGLDVPEGPDVSPPTTR